MKKFSDHQRRIWQQMLQIIEDYLSEKILYAEMVGNLEGALDAGDFKDENIREKWYDLWTPLEIFRATEGDVNEADVKKNISKMQNFLEEVLIEID